MACPESCMCVPGDLHECPIACGFENGELPEKLGPPPVGGGKVQETGNVPSPGAVVSQGLANTSGGEDVGTVDSTALGGDVKPSIATTDVAIARNDSAGTEIMNAGDSESVNSGASRASDDLGAGSVEESR